MMTQTLANARHRDILLALIETHIATAEPVGSRSLGRRCAFSLSPATIRNVMSDLEEEGFLAQPHASAGRVPTEKAYRYYADALLSSPRPLPPPSPAELRGMRDALRTQEGGVEDILRRASRVLSSLSHYAGLVFTPRLAHRSFRRVDLVRLHPGTVLVILVTTAGEVQNHLVEGTEDHPQEALERMARLLNQRFAGMSLPEVRRRILAEMREEKADYDRLLASALALGSRALEGAEGEEELLVEGSSNILEVPEFAADMEKMRSLFRSFEEKGHLVGLLDRAMEARGLTVVIGAEARLPGMEGVSLVAATYDAGPVPLGTLGILGPTRMDYPHVIPLVQATARALSERLSTARGSGGLRGDAGRGTGGARG
jgi:heat-inducible transcriptional repressor